MNSFSWLVSHEHSFWHRGAQWKATRKLVNNNRQKTTQSLTVLLLSIQRLPLIKRKVKKVLLWRWSIASLTQPFYKCLSLETGEIYIFQASSSFIVVQEAVLYLHVSELWIVLPNLKIYHRCQWKHRSMPRFTVHGNLETSGHVSSPQRGFLTRRGGRGRGRRKLNAENLTWSYHLWFEVNAKTLMLNLSILRQTTAAERLCFTLQELPRA